MPKNAKPTKSARRGGTLLGAYVPKGIVQTIDDIVTTTDSDRSKWLRSAVREKIERDTAKVQLAS